MFGRSRHVASNNISSQLNKSRSNFQSKVSLPSLGCSSRVKNKTGKKSPRTILSSRKVVTKHHITKQSINKTYHTQLPHISKRQSSNKSQTALPRNTSSFSNRSNITSNYLPIIRGIQSGTPKEPKRYPLVKNTAVPLSSKNRNETLSARGDSEKSVYGSQYLPLNKKRDMSNDRVSGLFSSQKKTVTKSIKGARTTKAKGCGADTRSLLSARRRKVNSLQSELEAMERVLTEMKQENKILREQNIRHEKALNRVIKNEANQEVLPSMSTRHQEEIRTLRDQIRRLRESLNHEQRRCKAVLGDQDVMRKEMNKVQSMVSASRMMDRDLLKTKVFQLERQIIQRDKRIEELERYIANLQKNNCYQIENESAKHRETQRKYNELANRVSSLEQSLREKDKLLNAQNIYCHRPIRSSLVRTISDDQTRQMNILHQEATSECVNTSNQRVGSTANQNVEMESLAQETKSTLEIPESSICEVSIVDTASEHSTILPTNRPRIIDNFRCNKPILNTRVLSKRGRLQNVLKKSPSPSQTPINLNEKGNKCINQTAKVTSLREHKEIVPRRARSYDSKNPFTSRANEIKPLRLQSSNLVNDSEDKKDINSGSSSHRKELSTPHRSPKKSTHLEFPKKETADAEERAKKDNILAVLRVLDSQNSEVKYIDTNRKILDKETSEEALAVPQIVKVVTPNIDKETTPPLRVNAEYEYDFTVPSPDTTESEATLTQSLTNLGKIETSNSVNNVTCENNSQRIELKSLSPAQQGSHTKLPAVSTINSRKLPIANCGDVITNDLDIRASNMMGIDRKKEKLLIEELFGNSNHPISLSFDGDGIAKNIPHRDSQLDAGPKMLTSSNTNNNSSSYLRGSLRRRSAHRRGTTTNNASENIFGSSWFKSISPPRSTFKKLPDIENLLSEELPKED